MLFSLFSIVFYCLFLYGYSGLPNTQSFCMRKDGSSTNLKLTETILPTNAPLDDGGIYFASSNKQIIFVRSTSGDLFRSEDEGFSWSLVNTSLTGGIARVHTAEVQEGDISVYLLGNQNGLYSSKDGGATFNYYNTLPSGVSFIRPHPAFSGLALAYKTSEIWLTENTGETWIQILNNVCQAYPQWSAFHNSSKRIYALVAASDQPNDCRITYSDDNFKTRTDISQFSRVTRMSIYAPNKFAAVTCEDSTCASKQLYVSEDEGATFNLARFPDVHEEVMDEKEISVREITDDAIWAYVKRKCTSNNNNCWGDLFHSNAVDKDFVLSLKYSAENQFTKYNALDGIYLSNQYITNGDQPQDEDLVRSLITFNKGSSWDILKAPAKDSLGQPIDCKRENGCSLHVHGYRQDHPLTYFYSIPNAPGLMIASGNTGTRLDHTAGNTYVSHDGGTSWKEIRKNPYVPEIGDYGSIIVMVREEGVTDELVYTTKGEGDEWIDCKFTNIGFDVSNIRVDPEWGSRRFILYGRRNVGGNETTVITQLNFDDEFAGKCTEEDLEIWSPKDENGACVLGVAKNYLKRKLGRNCYLGSDFFSAEVNYTVCPCTYDDFECDTCFYRPELTSPCTLECTDIKVPEVPSTCNGSGNYYAASIGYRYVNGSRCDKAKGVAPPNGLIPCPPIPFVPAGKEVGLSAIPIVISIVLIIGILAAVGFYLYKKNDKFRDFLIYTLGIEEPDQPLQQQYQQVEQDSMADD